MPVSPDGVGKNCPGTSAGCLNGNTGIPTLAEAWERCGEVADCGYIMKYVNGMFYLRRSSDPDRVDMEGFTYDCNSNTRNPNFSTVCGLTKYLT